ncbi:hypothetical protein ATSB10_27590 [Dyella thiooxydans]|uniref:Uncharacterized protein n=1 Tax=Dyella thiooxydans TaxID=445710 RepID=A0A160N2R5_9GAMM|nr:hypothetical protein ATSB10_27590 [Dyella thiooxydans]
MPHLKHAAFLSPFALWNAPSCSLVMTGISTESTMLPSFNALLS